jgi:hypothetical protein
MFDYDSPATLKIGDSIIEGTPGSVRQIVVKNLSICSPRGVPKMHVNTDYCYDSIATIKIKRG